MRIFVTGATGFIGTAIVEELLRAGHQVLGLARSDASAGKLIAAGAEVHHGDLEDLESLRRGAAGSEGVIHAGFIHDFSRFKEVCLVDKQAIDTIAEVLVGSDRPFIVTSGTALISPGNLATEDMKQEFDPAAFRLSEQGVDAAVAKGVRAAAMRLSPSVHGNGDHGVVDVLTKTAREKGFSAYVGDGLNRWNAVHRLDAARLFRLAIENAMAGKKYHAVSESSLTYKAVAQTIGQQLNVPAVSIEPQEAESHFGLFHFFTTLDCPASSKLTQTWLDWQPTQPTLFTDIKNGVYGD